MNQLSPDAIQRSNPIPRSFALAAEATLIAAVGIGGLYVANELADSATAHIHNAQHADGQAAHYNTVATQEQGKQQAKHIRKAETFVATAQLERSHGYKEGGGAMLLFLGDVAFGGYTMKKAWPKIRESNRNVTQYLKAMDEKR